MRTSFLLGVMLFLVSKPTFAFSTIGRHCRSKGPRYAPLHMNFLEEIQKNIGNAFSTDTGGNTKYYTVGITGASGLVGTALRDELRKTAEIKGKPIRIISLIRGSSTPDAEELKDDSVKELTAQWNPYGTSPASIINPDVFEKIDAIVHLSGENVGTGLGPLGFTGIQAWSEEKKKRILDSRVASTTALAQVIGKSATPKQFLVASGIGVYGSDFVGEKEAVDESMDCSSSAGFLAEISRQWEAATKAADNGKNRVVNMRFGVVMSKKGGALAKLYPIFFLGGGGNVGSGKQYFSFVSARDLARAIVHTLKTPSLKGPVNFSAPEPCTNAEFTKALGKVLNRPTILPLPEFVVSLVFGEMGDEMLLGGTRAVPTKLMKSGFSFAHPNIEAALRSAVDEEI